MISWIITSSVLIAAVLALRTALKGRISLRLQYALWLLVLVRLLVPVNPLNTALSVMNAVPPVSLSLVSAAPESPTLPSAASQSGAEPQTDVQENSPTVPAAPSNEDLDAHSAPKLTAETILRMVWLAGILAVTAALLISNLLFAKRLRRVRRPFPARGTRLPVYLADGLPSPCLFGLVRPAIYLTPEAVANETRLRQILTHEETHFRHGDHWWSLLRGVALGLHWYNPLVWLAAVISRRDAELCCDEDTIRRLGEEQRLEYGQTLLSMVSLQRGPAGLFSCATTMTPGKRGLRERITLLANRPKTAATAAVCLLLAVTVAAGCTFTGAASSGSAAQTDETSASGLPDGYKLTATVPLEDVQAYTPGSQTVTPAEAPTSDIAEIMPDDNGKDGVLTLSDGTEVLCYRDKSGDKYWALKRGDTLTRFTQEENFYTDGYFAEPYQGVFGHDGFRIICPRGAAYIAYDYYYLDKNGSPRLLAGCSNSVTEADLNGDGAKELLWHYHGSESYYYFERDGKLYMADVNGLLRDILPDWIGIDSASEPFNQETGLLPIIYRTIVNGPEHKAFLRFTPDSIEALEQTAPEEMAVYDCQGGIKIGIPAKYADQLIVQTEFDLSEFGETYGMPLMKVSEKASVEAGKADGMSDGVGWLFTIRRLTRAQYEQYLCGDRSEEFAFAASGTDGDGQYGNVGQYTAPVYDNYYVYSTATDVQFYRSGGEISTQSDAWKNWEDLYDMGGTVRTDMISRNGLTAYSDDDFLKQDFTYDSAHAYIKYYPYYTFDGDKSLYDTLILSQPTQSIRPGKDSVWCVERWYDEFGNCYPYFPSFDVIEQENVTAAEYYNRLQQSCEAGSGTDVEMRQLTSLGAAQWFVAKSGWFRNPNAAAGSFAETDGLDTAYMAQNVQAQQLALDLMAKRTVGDESLLSCAGNFTADTWGVLGRFEYGSDWWTPMKAALVKAASGDRQDLRDQKLLHLYLSYPKTAGAVADGLNELLSALYQADQATFDQVLSNTCTAAEQARIRAALG